MENVVDLLKREYDNYLEMLETLVNIDSGSTNIDGVNRVSRVVEEKFAELQGDYSIERIAQENCGDHLFITKKGRIPGKILLLAHMDTVFAEGTAAIRPYKVEGSRAYGPGVIDDKGCITAICFALKVLDKVYGQNTKTIEVLFNSDEEISSINSREIIEKKAKEVDSVLIIESARANGDVVTSRKGIGKYTIKVAGKAAHAGTNPQEGSNAIIELCQKTSQLSALTNYEKGTTVNVGVIKGGTTPNTVPSYAEAILDVRTTTLEEAKRVEKSIEEIISMNYVKGTSTVLEGGIKRPPMERTPKNVALYKITEELANKLGIQIGEAFAGGGSDGNFTSALGIATLDALGPIGGGYHGEDEFIDLDSIVPRIALLILLIKRLSEN